MLNVSTGDFVRDVVGDGTLSDSLHDVLICTTGPLGIPEMYVSDCDNHHIAVLDPLTRRTRYVYNII